MSFPSTYNFSYYRGDTNEFVVRPKIANGDEFDLTGYTAIYKIADVRGPDFTGTQKTGSAIVDTANNLITCKITSTVGRTIVGASAVYDIQITDGTNIYTVLTGTITITEDVTGAA